MAEQTSTVEGLGCMAHRHTDRHMTYVLSLKDHVQIQRSMYTDTQMYIQADIHTFLYILYIRTYVGSSLTSSKH